MSVVNKQRPAALLALAMLVANQTAHAFQVAVPLAHHCLPRTTIAFLISQILNVRIAIYLSLTRVAITSLGSRWKVPICLLSINMNVYFTSYT